MEYKGGHLGVRRIVKQEVQRVLRHALFALPLVGVNVKRQPCDRFGKNAYTGVDHRRLHRSSLIDRLARRCLSKEKGQAAEVILGLVP